jgi:hypothetical protein
MAGAGSSSPDFPPAAAADLKVEIKAAPPSSIAPSSPSPAASASGAGGGGGGGSGGELEFSVQPPRLKHFKPTDPKVRFICAWKMRDVALTCIVCCAVLW